MALRGDRSVIALADTAAEQAWVCKNILLVPIPYLSSHKGALYWT